ncbi:hypothetical protein [Maribacter sp. Hel_I_7]|jgi:hypothetical protein|uniref:hypothetical protein n=1 Tax=Maribacter sp. Hel_I_7 TaxID=1249997 RepID=UPI000479E313|nr:hypothetical protein [Maribacter sp. Hel_I_7]|tara:strand:+ start:5360 stop:5608 length:249 start_codon:yes stop_codon:yes gene_type:complete
MYKVIGFKKILQVESPKPYGRILIRFQGENSVKNTGTISLSRFIALSHILENDNVGYNPENNIFYTEVEEANYQIAPKGKIS